MFYDLRIVTARILNLFTKDTNVVDQMLARVRACSNRAATPLRTYHSSGYPICCSHAMLFRWNTRRHRIKLPSLFTCGNSSWLAIYPFYGVSDLVRIFHNNALILGL